MAITPDAPRLGTIKEVLPNNRQSLPMPKNLYTTTKEALPQRDNPSRIVINQIVSSGKEALFETTIPPNNLPKKGF